MRALGVLLLGVGLVLALIVGAWGRSGFSTSQAPVILVLVVGTLICLGAGAAMLRYRPSAFESAPRASTTVTERVLGRAAVPTRPLDQGVAQAAASVAPAPTSASSTDVPAGAVDEATRDRTPRVGDWILILPDASVVPITDGLVIGRQPVSSEGAAAAAVPSLEVSKSHARFGVVQGQLGVRDLDTTNGTVVVHPDGSEESVSPQTETALGPGDRLEIGSYALEVERRS